MRGRDLRDLIIRLLYLKLHLFIFLNLLLNVLHILLLFLALRLIDRLLRSIAMILQLRTDIFDGLSDLEWQFHLLHPFILDRIESILYHVLVSLAD